MSKTIGQVLAELQSLKTKAEANRYLLEELNGEGHQHVWSNIKYITGYLGNEERNRILNLFKVEE